ncbi:MAG TPA: hypothetical protein VF522_01435 [Ramlibacter sp.]|uniref:hypothetical protein n=1 Tax=Ramlibacter sp. TaxID=1917967 RepID=UPI002ECFD87F
MVPASGTTQVGPPPFRFEPRVPGGLRAPAFSRTFRLIATAIVAGSAWWMFQLWQSGKLAPAGSDAVVALGWPLAALALMAYTWWHIQTSTTRLTAEGLHQTWIWDKKMELRELAYGKLFRVRGLEWLIAPRLYVRTLLGKFAVFYTADREMLAEFERLIQELQAFRGFR